MLFQNCKIAWAKLLGAPRPTKFNEKGEWSFELTVTDQIRQALKDHGLSTKIKTKEDGTEVLLLRRKGFRVDGSPAKPISVVDHHNDPWDQSKLIGNGSTVNVSVMFEAYGEGKKPKFAIKPMAVQVWDHQPYKRSDFPTRDDAPVTNPEPESW